MQTLIKVLDHGFVRLVDSMGSDLSVVRAARVSYDAEPRGDGTDAKLIRYLMLNRHTSPFESVNFTFEVKCPLFIAAQWQRHRTWKYNQVSARYTELPEEFYIPDAAQITTQSETNKQMRTTEQHPEAQDIQMMIGATCDQAFAVYKHLLKMGAPRELARSVLPVGTFTRYFATVDLHNLFHFLRLRLHAHAQYEIRVYAEALLELITPIVPVSVQAFKETLSEKR